MPNQIAALNMITKVGIMLFSLLMTFITSSLVSMYFRRRLPNLIDMSRIYVIEMKTQEYPLPTHLLTNLYGKYIINQLAPIDNIPQLTQKPAFFSDYTPSLRLKIQNRKRKGKYFTQIMMRIQLCNDFLKEYFLFSMNSLTSS